MVLETYLGSPIFVMVNDCLARGKSYSHHIPELVIGSFNETDYFHGALGGIRFWATRLPAPNIKLAMKSEVPRTPEFKIRLSYLVIDDGFGHPQFVIEASSFAATEPGILCATKICHDEPKGSFFPSLNKLSTEPVVGGFVEASYLPRPPRPALANENSQDDNVNQIVTIPKPIDQDESTQAPAFNAAPSPSPAVSQGNDSLLQIRPLNII